MIRKQTKYFITCMMGMALFLSHPSYSFATVKEDSKIRTTTTYTDDEGNKKTIYWVDNITPPKMGGKDSEFIKKESTEANGVKYVEYVAPYTAGKGWYDVNKSSDQKLDAFLCYSAAAANTLHWWFDQNKSYINQYLAKYPNASKADQIRDMQSELTAQQGSKIYKRFVDQFAYRREGYWPDILHDQFINGYRPKPSGGVTDPSFEGSSLIEKGPDEKGGFFYQVFGKDILTQRRYYDFANSYQHVSNDLKSFLAEGKIVTLTYAMGGSAHVVTVWGAEYDVKGNLSGVYYSDSDDTDGNGMRRYRVMNKNGNAYVTTDTRVNGGGSMITCLTTLSTGKQVWDKMFTKPQTELNLYWDNTKFIYDGSIKTPGLKAWNVLAGDNITLTAEGGQSEAGTHNATAKLSGMNADKYVLPSIPTKEFTIEQSDTIFKDGIKTYRKNDQTRVFDKGDQITVTVTPKAQSNTSLSPLYGKMSLYIGNKLLAAPVNIKDGAYTFTFDSTNQMIQEGSNTITAKFHDDKNMKNHEEQVVIVLRGDDYTLVSEVSATCETDGVKAHYIDRNGKLYIDVDGNKKEVSKQDLVLQATGHQPGKWVHEDDHHYRECLNGCGIHLHEGACTGGNATLTEQATCEICGHLYGDKLERPIMPPLTPLTPLTPATPFTPLTPLKPAQPVKPGGYDMISGAGGSYELSGNGSLTFRANGDFAKFVGIKINGKVIDKKYYTAKSGSTIITLHPEFLNTLPVGSYNLQIDYVDGLVTCSFEVKAKADANDQETNSSELIPLKPSENHHTNSNNENKGLNTGDSTNLLVWFMLIMLSSATVLAVSKKTNMK